MEAPNSNVKLVMNFGPVMVIVSMALGAWAKAVGAAKTTTKAAAHGCIGIVQTIRPVWVAVNGCSKDQAQNAIPGMTYTKWQVRAVPDKGFMLCVIKTMRETSGIKVIDKHLLTASMQEKVLALAE